MGKTEGEERAYSQRLHQIRTTERHKWMHENVRMQSTYSCRDYIERQRDIITMAMPTIESVPKHDLLEQQIIFYTKTAMLNTTTAKLYGQSHKSGINYFNCIWLVFGARLSPENGGWENERERWEEEHPKNTGKIVQSNPQPNIYKNKNNWAKGREDREKKLRKWIMYDFWFVRAFRLN